MVSIFPISSSRKLRFLNMPQPSVGTLPSLTTALHSRGVVGVWVFICPIIVLVVFYWRKLSICILGQGSGALNKVQRVWYRNPLNKVLSENISQ